MVRFIDIYMYSSSACEDVFLRLLCVDRGRGYAAEEPKREREKKDVEENRATKIPEATVPKCAEGAWGLVTSEV